MAAQRPWAGVFLVALSAAGFATLGIFAKIGYQLGLNVTTMLAWRFGLAAGALWALWLLNPRRGALPPLRRLGLLLLMGGAGYTAMSFLFLSANRYIAAGLANAILYTYPALVTLLVALLGWERLTGARVLALAIAGAGTVLVVLSGQNVAGVGLTGVLLALGSAVVYAVYIALGSRVVAGVPVPLATACVCTAAGLVMAAWGAAAGDLVPVRGAGWWPVAGQALIATVVAVMCFFAGLQRIGPARAALTSTLEPVVSALLGSLVLGEFLGSLQLVGAALVVASVVALHLPGRSRPPGRAAATGSAAG